MKLSIAWIFDHIDADWRSLDIAAVVHKCNQTMAEIEGYTKVSLDVSQMSMARVKTIAAQVTMLSPEWRQEVALPVRKDLVHDGWYLIKKSGQQYAWVTMQDFHGDKDHLLPVLHCPTDQQAGLWKGSVEVTDYILEVDNKSITHRPDLWGHRGFARELAAMLRLPFKSLDSFVTKKKVQEYETNAPATQSFPFILENKAPEGCKRFAALYVPSIERRPSALWMAHRLCRVDAKSLDLVVDVTNYVMFDVGQPLHAFDAATLGKTIGPRWAHQKEALTLLDGTRLELDAHDMVIADNRKPLALAGIKGGAESGVSSTTQALLIEAACFDAATIRRSSARHKLRTEASARFEKSLDPAGTTVALERFAHLIEQELGSLQTSDVVVCGKNPVPVVITLSHAFIESRLGIHVQPSVVCELLRSVAFEVAEKDGVYTITVPTFRATKDITIKEDILEEIGRLYGFDAITPHLPYKPLQPSDVTPMFRVRDIKRIMASTLGARELYTYAFYDEEFLRQLQWQPDARLEVQNPVSEHWRRLVTSLIPHLIKAVAQNAPEHDILRFFEWARTWQCEGDKGIEKKSLAAIFFDKKKELDFYDMKELLTNLFTALDLPVTWQRMDAPEAPWFMPYQTATLWYDGIKIGVAGKVHRPFIHTVVEGDAFIVELDGDFLESYTKPLKKYIPASKYPEVLRDISMLMPLHYMVQELITSITTLSPRIVSVTLVDFFTKPEWVDKRSLTLRLTLQDEHKTLTKEEVDQIVMCATDMLTKQGAVVR